MSYRQSWYEKLVSYQSIVFVLNIKRNTFVFTLVAFVLLLSCKSDSIYIKSQTKGKCTVYLKAVKRMVRKV